MKLRVGLDCGQVTDPTAICVVEIGGVLGVSEPDGPGTPREDLNPLTPVGLREAGILPDAGVLPPGFPEPVRRGEREVPARRVPGDEALYTARHLERIRLGTAYTDVAVRVRVILERVRAKFDGRGGFSRGIIPELYVDATGVGLPVIDILRRELATTPHRLVPVSITVGEGYNDTVLADGQHGRPSEAPRSARGLRVGKGFLVSRLQALLQTRRLLLPRTEEAEALQSQLKDFQITVKQSRDGKYFDQTGARQGSHDDLVIAAALAVLDRPRQDARAVYDLNASMRDVEHVGFGGPGDAWTLPGPGR